MIYHTTLLSSYHYIAISEENLIFNRWLKFVIANKSSTSYRSLLPWHHVIHYTTMPFCLHIAFVLLSFCMLQWHAASSNKCFTLCATFVAEQSLIILQVGDHAPSFNTYLIAFIISHVSLRGCYLSQSINPFIHPSINLIHSSIHSSIHPFIHPSINQCFELLY